MKKVGAIILVLVFAISLANAGASGDAWKVRLN
jgi:hypothetical protein